MKSGNMLMFTLLLIVLSGAAYAAEISDYSARFEINSDYSVNEYIDVSFKESVLASNISFSFDGEPSDISIIGNGQKLNFNVLKDAGKTVIKPADDKFANNISIRFKTSSLIFQLGERSLFFTQLSSGQFAEKLHVSVALPEGFGISDNSYIPENAVVSTDGRKISLSWNFANQSATSISVKFEPLAKGFNMLIPVIIILLIAILLVYLKLKKRSKEDFLRGFSEDERKVLDYLERNPMAYQNKIEHEFKFSRAKMTRIVQKFEAKGLVEKKRKGRTNRLAYKR